MLKTLRRFSSLKKDTYRPSCFELPESITPESPIAKTISPGLVFTKASCWP
jgi:hypothetical protein